MNEENLTLETVNWYDKGNILKFFQKEGYFTNHTVDTLPYSADELLSLIHISEPTRPY